MPPRSPFVYGLAFLAALGLLVGAVRCLSGCAAPGWFTPAGAQGVDAAFAVLCPLESLASPALGGACPGEEAAFDAVVASRTAPVASAPPALVPLMRRGVPPEKPLVHIGSVPPSPSVVALQHAALALPPGPVKGKPQPAAALPVTATSAAVVAGPLPDGGTEAGR